MPILEAVAKLWFGTHGWQCGELLVVRTGAKRAGNGENPPFLITCGEQVLHVGPLTMKYLRDLASEQQEQGINVRVLPVER